MSRNLSSTHKTEIAQLGGNAQAYFVAFTAGATTYYWSTFGEQTHASQTWIAKGVTFGGLTSDGAVVSGVSMRVEDVDGVLRSIALIEDGDILVQVYAFHKAAGGTIEATRFGEGFFADEPRWDAQDGYIEYTLKSTVPLELPGLTMGVATGLGEMIPSGTTYAFGNEIITLKQRGEL